MSARLLFVGEAPSQLGARPLHPDDCDSGRRLARHTGWSREEFLRLSDRTNLFVLPIHRWSQDVHRRAYDQARLIARTNYERIICLGRNVERAVTGRDQEFFEWSEYSDEPGLFYATCPHPSGRTRWWNDAEHCAQARRFFNRLATDIWTPQSSPAVSPSPHAGGDVQPTTDGGGSWLLD